MDKRDDKVLGVFLLFKAWSILGWSAKSSTN